MHINVMHDVCGYVWLLVLHHIISQSYPLLVLFLLLLLPPSLLPSLSFLPSTTQNSPFRILSLLSSLSSLLFSLFSLAFSLLTAVYQYHVFSLTHSQTFIESMGHLLTISSSYSVLSFTSNFFITLPETLFIPFISHTHYLLHFFAPLFVSLISLSYLSVIGENKFVFSI